MYNYFENVKEDLLDVLADYEEYSSIENWNEENRDEIWEEVYNTAWTDDSVTGNGSGSYFFNSYKSGQALAGNFDLLKEAIEEFGGDVGNALDNEESADVTIRCYILGQVLDKVLDEYLADKNTEE